MITVLDTSVVIDIDNRVSSTIQKLASIRDIYPEIPKISFFTYFEFIYGLRKKQPHNKQKSMAFIENFDVLQTTKNTANILSILKEKYGDLSFSDLFIAAQSIENNTLLVTRDKDFDEITELNKMRI